ncbi:hypothetical protein PSP20601_04975 [Pandoraea sputorum]|nr:hypothetical protein PSP20601_04975 [Pandoraea sputorum]
MTYAHSAAISRASAAAPDLRELTHAGPARRRPAADVLLPTLGAAHADALMKRRGRPSRAGCRARRLAGVASTMSAQRYSYRWLERSTAPTRAVPPLAFGTPAGPGVLLDAPHANRCQSTRSKRRLTCRRSRRHAQCSRRRFFGLRRRRQRPGLSTWCAGRSSQSGMAGARRAPVDNSASALAHDMDDMAPASRTISACGQLSCSANSTGRGDAGWCIAENRTRSITAGIDKRVTGHRRAAGAARHRPHVAALAQLARRPLHYASDADNRPLKGCVTVRARRHETQGFVRSRHGGDGERH